MIQWLGLTLTAMGLGSSPGQGIELRSQQAAQHGQKKKKRFPLVGKTKYQEHYYTQHEGVLVFQPRIEPMTPVVEAWNPNHWITRGLIPSNIFCHSHFLF